MQSFVKKNLKDVVSGVHVLPFYPSSADRGYAPLTYKEVDSQYGGWPDIEAIAQNGDLCVDFMVNHMSAQSPEFKDFVEKHDKSDYKDLFIKWYEFWGGEPTDEDVDRIYTRKPQAPKREVDMADGSKETLWCTFSEEQIDMNVFNDVGDRYIGDQLKALADRCASHLHSPFV